MAVRKVYGSLDSPDTLKVLACLFEHQLDFEFISVDIATGENEKKPFLRISPFGQVPVFEDGGYTQFECRAIIRSMGHQYGKKGEELIFWNSQKQAVVSNWVDIEDHKFEPPALDLIFELLTKPKNGSAPDLVAVAKAEAELSKVLDVYEARLAEFKYLAANKYTIADVLHLPNLHSLMETPAKKLIGERARVSSWCSEILARPAWAKVMEMKLKAHA